MLTVKRDDLQVTLSIDADVPDYDMRRFPFSFNCNDRVYAGLLAAHLRSAVSETAKKIRQEEYNKGWADAKAKRTKREWFSGWL